MSNVGNFDIPAWVQDIWDQGRAHTKGESLFGTEASAQPDGDAYDATLHLGNDAAYVEGYRIAGRILADHIIQQSGWQARSLVYPICFLFRHHVELQLKRLIPAGAFLTGQALSEKQQEKLSKSHDLTALWQELEPFLRKLVRDLGSISDENIEASNSYIRQLSEIDRLSQAFRYPLTRLGTPTIDTSKHPRINVRQLAECMEKLNGWLVGLSQELGAACEEMRDHIRWSYGE